MNTPHTKAKVLKSLLSRLARTILQRHEKVLFLFVEAVRRLFVALFTAASTFFGKTTVVSVILASKSPDVRPVVAGVRPTGQGGRRMVTSVCCC